MKQPFGFNFCRPGVVLLLSKALYGNRQAGKRFFEQLAGVLWSGGWTQAKSDPSMHLYYSAAGGCIAVICVDDGILAGPESQQYK